MVIHMASSQPAPRSPTLSIGIATSPEHGHTGEDLLRGADAASTPPSPPVATALFVQRSIPLRLSDRRLAEISGVIATMPSPSSVERGPRNRRFVGFTMGFIAVRGRANSL